MPLALQDMFFAQTIAIVTPVTRGGRENGELRLIAGFNRMIADIAQRDAAFARHRADLE
ncbi:hypothetical protein [Saliniramus sp.]|uniref:hypothetical protein n=1 Tax=Saliniramus sp. TaxID=2986772 RepID=UPI002B6373CD|nr:hypothetical protein [Saliniramus sp.]HMB10047.1 hypothetical protein [Saliniramus sp.]